MSHALELIQSIQSCQPERLRANLARLAGERAMEFSGQQQAGGFSRNRVNDTLGGPMQLTALHVAAKAYSAHAQVDEHLAAVFDEMVADLLAAGADPAMEIGARMGQRFVMGRMVPCVVEPGQTVVEVCDGKLPPSLAQWFVDLKDDQNSGLRTEDQRVALSKRATRSWERRRECAMA